MDIHDVIANRRSIRKYRPQPVEPEKLQRVLEAGRLAPTAANRQAFVIYVVAGAGYEPIRAAYARDWCWEAPVVLVVCSRPAAAWTRGDGRCYADVDAAIVMDHMILAAAAEGLGTCWIGAFDAAALRAGLGLEDDLEPVCMTPLGYPEESPDARPRLALEAIVRHVK
jgi:nitroreductase